MMLVNESEDAQVDGGAGRRAGTILCLDWKSTSCEYSKLNPFAVFSDDILRPINDFSSNSISSSSAATAAAAHMPSFHTHFPPSPSLKSFAATAEMDALPSNVTGPSTILDPAQLQSSRVWFNFIFNLKQLLPNAQICNRSRSIPSIIHA